MHNFKNYKNLPRFKFDGTSTSHSIFFYTPCTQRLPQIIGMFGLHSVDDDTFKIFIVLC